MKRRSSNTPSTSDIPDPLPTPRMSRMHSGSEGLAFLSEALTLNSTLQNLDVSRNRFNEDGCSALARALSSPACCLFSLKMGGNHGAHAGLRSILNGLCSNSTLRILDLSHSRLGPPEVRHLVRMLRANNSLTQLELAHNEIGTSGAKALGRALRELGQTQNLKNTSQRTAAASSQSSSVSKWGLLRGGSSSSSLMSKVVAAATSSCRITFLDLSHNRIRDDGALELLAGASLCPSVSRLLLASNKIGAGEGSAQLFSDRLETLSAMRKLHRSLEEAAFECDLRFNQIETPGAIAALERVADAGSIEILLDGNFGLNVCPFSFPAPDVPQRTGYRGPTPVVTTSHYVQEQRFGSNQPLKEKLVEGLRKTVENAKLLRAHGASAARADPLNRDKRRIARHLDQRVYQAKRAVNREKARLRRTRRERASFERADGERSEVSSIGTDDGGVEESAGDSEGTGSDSETDSDDSEEDEDDSEDGGDSD